MDYRPKFFTLPPDDTWPGANGYPPYLFNENIAVAVDVALATDRPLLIAGPPGSGKSMLAPAIAGLLGWRFLRHTLTSRSRLEELTGELDQLRRLHDAQAATKDTALPPDWFYRKPGLLWWAFAPEEAARRGARPDEIGQYQDRFLEPHQPPGFNLEAQHAVLLLDEIDKAEPDLPNDLLEPLDRQCFQVPNGPEVQAPEGLRTLVMITTNGERELPQAFLRRCVSLLIEEPDAERLVKVADHHYADRRHPELFRAVADKLIEHRDDARQGGRRPPSTSEYLDAVRACLRLGIHPEHPLWQRVASATLVKENDTSSDTGTW